MQGLMADDLNDAGSVEPSIDVDVALPEGERGLKPFPSFHCAI